MKTNNIFASALLVLCASSFLFSPHNNVNTAATLHEPGDYMYRQRAYPSGSINHEAFKEAIAQAQAIRRSGNRATSIAWEFAGPTNFGGRITDIEMPASDQQTVYAGSASGGVFKSTDGGGSWVPVFDDAPSLSIGDLAIAPSDPNIIYVGTGESNCGGGSLTYDGLGVFKSTDAGTTWSAVGLADSRNTGKVAIHPGNPDIVYVAAMGDLFGNNSQRGIFKTTDGGQSWQNVLYVNDSTGGIDVVIHPLNPDTVYAATWKRIRRPNYKVYGGSGCGVYRSYDGGVSWTELTNGLPSPSSTQCGRIGIDIARSSPNILYAIYADSIGYFKGIYKTVNNGDSWTQTNDAALSSMYSSYGWWNGKINVDPSDPDIFFVGGLDLYRSTNGGASYSNVSGSMHVDQHGVYIHPANNNLVIAGNDGGIYISNNGGSSWNSVNELPNMQFYACTMDYTYPTRLYGGTQDNGTKRTLSGNINGYSSIFGGDGFQCIVDPTDNNYIYAESQYGYIGRSTNGGASFNIATIGISNGDRKNWNTPIRMHPLDPNTLFTGTHRLYKSTNRAQNWSAISGDLTNGSGGGNLVYGTITAISISAVDSLTIWVGTDDGNVQMSPDGGSSWNNVTGSLPKRWVTSVVADPYDAATAYVTISGYRFDEFLPHVFKTTDA
ncbi:MAG: hypothetical protein ACE5DN_04295, partial [Flavobacteriales bacterium]